MRILRGLASYPPDFRPCVAALGAFDGIHLAHAKLITTAVERGRALGLPSVVCTFDPPPASVLWPERAPLPIATLEDNLGRMGGLGADAALVTSSGMAAAATALFGLLETGQVLLKKLKEIGKAPS